MGLRIASNLASLKVQDNLRKVTKGTDELWKHCPLVNESLVRLMIVQGYNRKDNGSTS